MCAAVPSLFHFSWTVCESDVSVGAAVDAEEVAVTESERVGVEEAEVERPEDGDAEVPALEEPTLDTPGPAS